MTAYLDHALLFEFLLHLFRRFATDVASRSDEPNLRTLSWYVSATFAAFYMLNGKRTRNMQSTYPALVAKWTAEFFVLPYHQ